MPENTQSCYPNTASSQHPSPRAAYCGYYVGPSARPEIRIEATHVIPEMNPPELDQVTPYQMRTRPTAFYCSSSRSETRTRGRAYGCVRPPPNTPNRTQVCGITAYYQEPR